MPTLRRFPFHLAVIAVFSLFTFACASPEDTGSANTSAIPTGTVEQRVITNGGFEAGNYNGWTASGYVNNELSVSPPQTRAQLNLGSGGTLAVSISDGVASNHIPTTLSNASTLRYPRAGRYTAIINNDTTHGQNASGLKQTFTITAADIDPADGRIHIRMVVAPILVDSGTSHNDKQQPYFWVEAINTSLGNKQLFHSFNYSTQTGVPWKVEGSDKRYTDWKSFDISPPEADLRIGDQVQVELIAAHCSQGSTSHRGHLLVDDIAPILDGLFVSATAPSEVEKTSTFAYTVKYSYRGETPATGVVVEFFIPANSTYQGIDAPGLTCTPPSVGTIGDGLTKKLTCVVGNMSPAQNGSFQVLVQPINTGTINAGNYTIKSDQESALLGSLITTTVTTGKQFADLEVTATDDKLSLNWGGTTVYHVDVTNHGPDAANGATLTSTATGAPATYTWTCTSEPADLCPGTGSGSGPLPSTLPTLPSGGKLHFTLTATMGAGSGATTHTETFVVAPPTGTNPAIVDPSPGNSSAVDINSVVDTLYKLTIIKDEASGIDTSAPNLAVVMPGNESCGMGCTQLELDVANGTEIKLSAAAGGANTFVGFEVTEGAVTCTAGKTDCLMTINSNVTVKVKFLGPVLVNIVNDPVRDGGSTTPAAGAFPVVIGGSLSVTFNADPGFKLTGYTLDSIPTSLPGNLTTYTLNLTNLSVNREVSPTFEAIPYNIVATPPGVGGTISPAGTTTVTVRDTTTVTLTANPGYVLTGYTINGVPQSLGSPTDSHIFDLTNVTSNQTVAATFTAVEYDLTAVTQPGGSISVTGDGGDGKAIVTDTISVTLTADPEFRIKGYWVNGAYVELTNGPHYTHNFDLTGILENTTITPVFEYDDHLVTIVIPEPTRGITFPATSVKVPHNQNKTITMMAEPGSRIAGYTLDGTFRALPGSTMEYNLILRNVVAEHAVIVHFVADTYAIAVNQAAGGTISPSGESVVAAGGSITLTMEADPGYRLAGYVLDGITYPLPDRTTQYDLILAEIGADHVVTPVFLQDSRTLSVDFDSERGSATPTSLQTYPYGNKALVTFSPKSGYYVFSVTASIGGAAQVALDWKQDANAMSGSYEFQSMTEDVRVYVLFKQLAKNYTIATQAFGEGTISCPPQVEEGRALLCTITPKPGAALASFIDNGAEVRSTLTPDGASYTYRLESIAGNHFIIAQFKSGQGTLCSADGDCLTGICAEGFCCDRACDGQCEACDRAGAEGTCGPVPAGAPHASRPPCASDGTACGGTCDGVEGELCTYPMAETSCRIPSCTASVATVAVSCVGSGSCPALATVTCPEGCDALGVGCAPTAGGSPASCTFDSDCPSTLWCEAGLCTDDEQNGESCDRDAQCASGSCAYGVCCNVACDGQCEACDLAGSVGTCTPISGDPRPWHKQCADDGSLCGGTCNGVEGGKCSYPSEAVICQPESCANGTATVLARCSGEGSCAAPRQVQCPSGCDGDRCANGCLSDYDCQNGFWCAAGLCIPGDPNGASCTADNQCWSGHCTDGVCCERACGGQCEACDTSGHLGECLAITGAPHGERVACAAHDLLCGGFCDGTQRNKCHYPATETQCRDASCANGVAIAAALCDGKGACPPVVNTPCGKYECDGDRCGGDCDSNDDCSKGFWCSAGLCLPEMIDGQPCAQDFQCKSGECVDGLCCERACEGQCEACDVVGKEGQCVAVPNGGAPRGNREQCDTDGSRCGGACDGTNPAVCAYPTDSCRDDSCTGGYATPGANCDGAGNCPPGVATSCDRYVCAPTECLSSCASNSDCANGSWCNPVSKKCEATKESKNKESCVSDTECKSGACVDGYCCDGACTGQCEACDVAGKEGTCSVISGDPHGARALCNSDGSVCGGTCDGTQRTSCTYSTSSCRDASCVGKEATDGASCDGNGHCPAPVKHDCSPYLCDSDACKSSCATNDDCISGHWCDPTNTCVPKKPNGNNQCTADSQCASGNCVDGLCCNSACTGQCEACNVAGSEGLCSPVPAKSAPRGKRAACATDGSVCGGYCDGNTTATCAYPDALLTCRGATCTDGVATKVAGCNGAGACPVPTHENCSPYTCDGDACRSRCSNTSECHSGFWCTPQGSCVPHNGLGEQCLVDSQCGSNHCVDGLCCDTSCTGQCEACDLAGSLGRCAPVAGAPHGKRAACGSDGSLCGGLCDGTNSAACAYPGDETVCREASCSDLAQTEEASCDGAGHCPAIVRSSCVPYICGGDACKDECASSSDCIASHWCSPEKRCIPREKVAGSCGGDVECLSGYCIDGLCCDSDCHGQCEACNVPGRLGLCTPVEGAPRGNRPPCAAGTPVCGGTCDGTDGDRCAYPGAETQCSEAACEESTAIEAASCDNTGHCMVAERNDCATYRCDGVLCATDCASDADCAAGNYCVQGECLSKEETAKRVDETLVRGSGCDAAGGSAQSPLFAFGLLIVALFGLSRRGLGKAGRRAVGAAAMASAAAVPLLFAAPAAAQVPAQTDLELQRFQPLGGMHDILNTSSALTPGHLRWGLTAYLNYADRPLRLVPAGGGDALELVTGQTTLDLGGTIGLSDRFELSVMVPLNLTLSSDGSGGFASSLDQEVSSVALSAIRVTPKLRVLSVSDFHFALAAPISIPTAEAPYLGQNGPSVSPRAIGEYDGPVRVAANLGALLRRERQIVDLHVGNALFVSLAGELPFTLATEKLDLLANVYGEYGFEKGGEQKRPMELLGALRWWLADTGLAVTGGAGTGLNNGYGSPAWRVLLGLQYRTPEEKATPAPEPVVCPEPPPPPPPFEPTDDSATVQAGQSVELDVLANDRGAERADLSLSDVSAGKLGNAERLSNGRLKYNANVGQAGKDRLLYVASVKDGRMGKAWVDITVTEPPRVQIKADRIDITESVHFQTGSDKIMSDSFSLLDEVAKVIIGAPQLTKIRIEGHTDNKGVPSKNLSLSKRRAASVRKYLVAKGVEDSRLTSEGYGQERPIATNDTDEGRAKNRRVQMVVLERAD